jgi:hypothetical protein
LAVLKAAFFRWKRKYYSEIEFNSGQLAYLNIYFNNVESGSSAPLPEVRGKSVVQMLIAGFWEDYKEVVYIQTGPLVQ